MEFNFSTNNSMTEFETLDTSSTIYLGFANQPETNIFSQKYFRSPHASTTESLIKKLELLERPKKKESQVMMHLVQGWPTLDVSTAAVALEKYFINALNTANINYRINGLNRIPGILNITFSFATSTSFISNLALSLILLINSLTKISGADAPDDIPIFLHFIISSIGTFLSECINSDFLHPAFIATSTSL